MKKYTLVVKKNEKSENVAKKIKEKLDNFLEYNETAPDLVISVGGDGTILFAFHQYLHLIDQTLFLGVHTGTLGFYTDYMDHEIDQLVKDIRTGEYTVFERSILDTKLFYENEVKNYYSLNEMRIENCIYTQKLDVIIDDELLEVIRGNGVCISTPSGSTAYNKSLGGSVLHPSIHAMQLTEIASINHNAYRSLGSSLVLPSQCKITLQSDNFENSILGIDHYAYSLEGISKIEVCFSNHSMKCIQFKPLSFTSRLKRSFILK